jgi:hypothetical protein
MNHTQIQGDPDPPYRGKVPALVDKAVSIACVCSDKYDLSVRPEKVLLFQVVHTRALMF